MALNESGVGENGDFLTSKCSSSEVTTTVLVLLNSRAAEHFVCISLNCLF